MNPIIVYKGPSRFDGQPIVGLLKPDTTNEKTGNMATLYVMLQDVPPAIGVQTSADQGVCGNCPSRKGKEGPQCYTHSQMIYKGLWAMWKGWRNRTDCSTWTAAELGTWLRVTAAIVGSRHLRSAAYGDIAALPVDVLLRLDAARRLAKLGARGYTHQWRDPEVQHLKAWHMASVHTAADYLAAKDLGWRAFYTTAASTVSPKGAVLCPASKEAGKLTTCSVCTLCAGLERAGRDVYIPDHGPDVNAVRMRIQARRQTNALKIGQRGVVRVQALEGIVAAGAA